MTHALLSAVGAPGSLGLALTTSMRSRASPTSSSVEILLGWVPLGGGCSPGLVVGVAMPVTSAIPPGPSRQMVSSLCVPFSSFSIDSWRRLVMTVVLTDALIWAKRSRYGLAAGDFPHGDSTN